MTEFTVDTLVSYSEVYHHFFKGPQVEGRFGMEEENALNIAF